MSEKLTDLLDCLPPVARGDRVSVPRETYERVRAAISEVAAAEERGRRSGVEEAAKIADDWYVGMSHAPRSPGDTIRSKLAPRDSAPKRVPYVEAGVDDWSGAPRDDMTKAPRDSGKDGQR